MERPHGKFNPHPKGHRSAPNTVDSREFTGCGGSARPVDWRAPRILSIQRASTAAGNNNVLKHDMRSTVNPASIMQVRNARGEYRRLW